MRGPATLCRHLLLATLTLLQRRSRPLPPAGTAPFFMSTKAFDRLNDRKSKVATYNLDMKLVGAWLTPEGCLQAQSTPDRCKACVSMSSLCCGCLACTGADGRPHAVMVLKSARPSARHRPEVWCLSVGRRLLGLVRQEMVRAESTCVSMHEQLGWMTPLQRATHRTA